jgi:hypothetical protein
MVAQSLYQKTSPHTASAARFEALVIKVLLRRSFCTAVGCAKLQ